MKIQDKGTMKAYIEKGKYFIVEAYEDGVTKYYIASGKGMSMTFRTLTKERAMEWIELGAEVILL